MTVIGIALVLLIMVKCLIGFLLPPILRIINKDIQGDDERQIMTYLVCFLAAMALEFQSFKSGDLVSIGMWFLLVNTEAQAAFKLFFKPRWDNKQLQDSSNV